MNELWQGLAVIGAIWAAAWAVMRIPDPPVPGRCVGCRREPGPICDRCAEDAAL